MRAAPWRNPILNLTAFIALIELNLGVAIVLQERRVSDGTFSSNTAELAFAGALTFCVAPFQVIVTKVDSWKTSTFASVASDTFWTFIFLLFHFAGASALSAQILYNPSSEPFVHQGTIGLLAISWLTSILLSFILTFNLTFFIRRWAGWEDGVSKLPVMVLWEEGWWGGGVIKREAQEEWKRKSEMVLASQMAEEWKAQEKELEKEREKEARSTKAKGKKGRDVTIVVGEVNRSEDSGFDSYVEPNRIR
ncbi:hypothetical protein P7C70_g178, partial [Phenoliferia sp. Uapishka_3]